MVCGLLQTLGFLAVAHAALRGAAGPTARRALTSTSQLVYANGPKWRVGKSTPDTAHGIDDLIQLGQMASPFDLDTVSWHEEAGEGDTKLKVSKILTEEDLATANKIAASVKGSYSGFSGSVDSTYSSAAAINAKSSAYELYFDKAFPQNTLDQAKTRLTPYAADLLKNNPAQFVSTYGKHYVAGYVTGCQSTVRITVTAKSEQEKKDLDIEVGAKYAGFGAAVESSGSFSDTLRKSTKVDSTSISIDNVGTINLPFSLDDAAKVHTEIIEPLTTGKACTKDSSKVLRVIVMPWLSNQQVVEHIRDAGAAEAVAALMPIGMQPAALEDLSDLLEKVKAKKTRAEMCHNDIFQCTTQNWNENPAPRQEAYDKALTELQNLEHTLALLDEDKYIADPSVVTRSQNQFEEVFKRYLRPAELMPTLTFRISGSAKTEKEEKPFNIILKVDPNRDNTRTCEQFPGFSDNGDMTKRVKTGLHPTRNIDACKSAVQPLFLKKPQGKKMFVYHKDGIPGTFYASFVNGKLVVWQSWELPGLKSSLQVPNKALEARPSDHPETRHTQSWSGSLIQTTWSVAVEYGNPFTQ